jgi:threonine dehydratase
MAALDRPGVLATIGATPLVRLRRIVPLSGAELWIKLEYLNPTGSKNLGEERRIRRLAATAPRGGRQSSVRG